MKTHTNTYLTLNYQVSYYILHTIQSNSHGHIINWTGVNISSLLCMYIIQIINYYFHEIEIMYIRFMFLQYRYIILRLWIIKIYHGMQIHPQPPPTKHLGCSLCK